MCHVEVWGVTYMCQGWCCLYQWQNVKSLDLIESQDWKCQGKLGYLVFSDLCDVSWGRKFLMRGSMVCYE